MCPRSCACAFEVTRVLPGVRRAGNGHACGCGAGGAPPRPGRCVPIYLYHLLLF